MKAELISVGTELLLGQITDTNATWICQALAEHGIDVHFRTTVGDNQERMAEALRLGLARSDVVIVTGGLGPTSDDLTREAIAEVTGRQLVPDPAAADHIRAIFARLHRKLSPSNIKQAMVPEGGRLISNSCGTAPGVLVEQDGKAIVAVPGVPREMRAMMAESVIPYLKARPDYEPRLIKSRVVRLVGIGESAAAEAVADLLDTQTDPTIAPLAGAGEVTFRITTKSASEGEAEQKLEAMELRLRERLGDAVYGVDEQTMAEAVGRLLRLAGKTLATAESCTGGLIATRITDVPGSSDYFLGGIVAYSNDVKVRELGVLPGTLALHGAVSAEVAREMAAGVRRQTGADYGLSATGVAGPSGGSDTKPVGLVYVGLASERGVETQELHLFGDREMVRLRASQGALDMLRRSLLTEQRAPG